MGLFPSDKPDQGKDGYNPFDGKMNTDGAVESDDEITIDHLLEILNRLKAKGAGDQIITPVIVKRDAPRTRFP